MPLSSNNNNNDLANHIPSILEKIGRQEGHIEAIHEDVTGIKKDVKSLTITSAEMNNRQGHLLKHMDDLVKVYREQATLNKEGIAECKDKVHNIEYMLADYPDYKKKVDKLNNNHRRLLWWVGGFGTGVGGIITALWNLIKNDTIKF